MEISTSPDLYVSTVFLSLSLFLSFLTARQTSPTWFSTLGARYSVYVYVFHIAVETYYLRIHVHLPVFWQELYGLWIAPLVVLLLTLAFIAALRKIRVLR